MRNRLQILGVGVDRLTADEALQKIDAFITHGRETGVTHQIVTANAEII